ncbi:MAG: hypothetical protein QXK24_07540 [Ignisphaera sp.]
MSGTIPLIGEGLECSTHSQLHTVRVVFIVDLNGMIRVILYYPHELGRNIDEILRMVITMQTSDKLKIAIPANWPNNELVGDRVIVPPARTVQEAAERVKQYECCDWWFLLQSGKS